MEIKIKHGTNCEDLEWQDMFIDGKHKISVYPLCECPEDAIIGRDLISCEEIADLMKLAYEAGKNGEKFDVNNESEA